MPRCGFTSRSMRRSWPGYSTSSWRIADREVSVEAMASAEAECTSTVDAWHGLA